MRKAQLKLTAAAIAVAATQTLCGQQAPPPPPQPFPGLLNEWLRQDHSNLSAWDIGGAVRLRYETKDGYGIPGLPGSMDFRGHGADVANDYLMSRLRLRVGYTGEWLGALVEGRSSAVASDQRLAATAPVARAGYGPESDLIDLHQAYLFLGNPKEFPLLIPLFS